MNLVLVLLFGGSLLCVGILIGIVANQRTNKAQNTKVINTICDEIVELQAVLEPAKVDWEHLQAIVDTRVKEVVSSKMLEGVKTQVHLVNEQLSLPKEVFSSNVINDAPILVEEGSMFSKYARDPKRLNTLRIKQCPISYRYYLQTKLGWVYYFDKDGFITADTENALKRETNENLVYFYNYEDAAVEYFKILERAKVEALIKA